MHSMTQQRLVDLLQYNPDTGLFYWKAPTTNRVKTGELAGRTHCRGYVVIGIDKKIYPAHRLAWIWSTGITPKGEVDHINGNKSDNRWANLRVVDKAGNQQNKRRPNRDNTTGFLGVSKHKDYFRAQINVNGVRMSLGYFKTPELAQVAYLDAKRKHHKTCTI